MQKLASTDVVVWNEEDVSPVQISLHVSDVHNNTDC